MFGFNYLAESTVWDFGFPGCVVVCPFGPRVLLTLGRSVLAPTKFAFTTVGGPMGPRRCQPVSNYCGHGTIRAPVGVFKLGLGRRGGLVVAGIPSTFGGHLVVGVRPYSRGHVLWDSV